MFAYAVATIPLIRLLALTQIWYADDSSVVGEISELKKWMDNLLSVGPLFGYFPEPPKCSLIVRESHVTTAEKIFSGSEVKIILSNRYLGGVVGNEIGMSSFIESKVREWSRLVELLSVEQPQAAYVSLTKSLQSQWIFQQRVSPNCGNLFGILEQALSTQFIPSLFGQDRSPLERLLYSLPIRMGGLNIQNPTTTASHAYSSSSRSSAYILTESIKSHTLFRISDHESNIHLEQTAIRTERDKDTFTSTIDQFDEKFQRAIIR